MGYCKLPTLGGGATHILFNPPTDFAVKQGNGELTLTWTDPSDIYIESQLFSAWTRTVLVMNIDHTPTSPSDGTVVLVETTRDQYKSTGYKLTGLINGATYYFSLFSYGKNCKPSTAVSASGTPMQYRIMTIKIDQSNSNPSTCCTYDDAVDMTAGSSDWDDFFGYKPCLFKDGAVVGYLNPNNYAQFEDGSAADITSGDAGDVMVEFPRMGLNISTSGDVITISMTDNPHDSNFKYLAHNKGSEEKDFFYIGAYDGYSLSSKLRSISGKAPTVNKTISAFRTLAQANGFGYDMWGFYQLTFLQAMYYLKYKNLNSQAALGNGYVGGSAAQSTGGTNTKGLCYGNTSSTTDRVKLFGIEDFYGNVFTWIDGIKTNSSYKIMTANNGFNNNATGYTTQSNAATGSMGNYMSKAEGTSECGFVPKAVSGSSTTYWCDYADLDASCFAVFGGYWNYGSYAGVSHLRLYYSASYAGSYVAARLRYL